MIDLRDCGADPEDKEPLDEFAQSLILWGRKPRTFSSPEASWGDFSARMSALSTSVEPVSAVRALPQGAESPNPLASHSPASSSLGSASSAAGQSSGVLLTQTFRIFAFGTLFGGAVIGGLWLNEKAKHSPTVDEPAPVPVVLSPQHRVPAESSPARAQEVEVVDRSAGSLASASPSANATTEPLNGPGRLPPTHRKTSPTQPPSARSSSLAEQTRLLEEARQEDPSRTLSLIYAFHQSYPQSPLKADAEVVALGALRSLGKTEAFKKRAEIYLKRYPRDPHTQRVKNWLSQAAFE